jgi:4,5:9,10-diseco-3-hydroxy-5,9,17-trioxoandrosta-1(10),2-diene-4-oate hydrolase
MKGNRAQLGVDEPFSWIEIDGVRLAYSDEGDGEPVVCLHAIGHGARDFGELRRRLREHRRVLTLDWPGQGRSSADHASASARRYEELIGEFLAKLDVERPVLLGNSIGGAAALQWAVRHPVDVRGLVLCNAGGLAPVDLLTRSFSRAMAAFFAAGARGARWFQPAFAAYYRVVLQRASAAEHRVRIVAAGHETAPVLSEAWASFARAESDLRSLAPAVRCPVFCAWARGDTIVAYPRSRKAIRGFPNGEARLFRGGHAAFLEDADAFYPALDTFLERASCN